MKSKGDILPGAKVIDSSVSDTAIVSGGAEVPYSCVGKHVIVGSQAIIVRSEIEDNVSINRRNYIFRSSIERYSYTGIGTSIRSAQVGRFCSMSWNVSIGGGEHPQDNVTTGKLSRFYLLDAGKWDRKSKKELDKTFESQKQCIVGSDVLISTNAVILRNIEIGNGAIIGAGAVVVRDVEPYSIVAGVPARVIKKRFDDKTIETLERIQWWNWPREVIRENLELVYSSKVNQNVLDRLTELSKSIKAV